MSFVKHKSQIGSSLSEVIIVLALLGIVFTLTLGVMVADYNKNQTVVRLEKTFLILSKSLRMSVTQNSEPDTWWFPTTLSETDSYSFFEKYLKPHLILTLDCKNSIDGNCTFDFKELDGEVKSLNSSWVRFYLNNGAFVAMQAIKNKEYKVLYFYVDINGKKRLNVVGRDIFMFEYWIENPKHKDWVGVLLPYGHEFSHSELISDKNLNNCNSNSKGNYCGALIWMDGWQIKYGYPWAHARHIIK